MNFRPKTGVSLSIINGTNKRRPQSGPDQQLGAQEHLWQADIRPSAYKEHEKKNRKVERFLARAGKVAGVAAAVLLVLEILVMLSGGWVGSMQAQSNGNESQVQKILSKGISSQSLQSVQLIICSLSICYRCSTITESGASSFVK